MRLRTAVQGLGMRLCTVLFRNEATYQCCSGSLGIERGYVLLLFRGSANEATYCSCSGGLGTRLRTAAFQETDM